MKIHSLAMSVVAFGMLTTMSFSQMNSSPNAMHVMSTGAADPNAVTHFSVYLPLTQGDALEKLLAEQTDPVSANYHRWLTPAEFKSRFGPSRSDVAKVTAALLSQGFTITAEHTQYLEVEGSVSAVERTFSIHMMQAQMSNGQTKFASAEGHLTLPAALASAGAVVPAFTTRLAAHVHSVKLARSVMAVKPAFRLSSLESLYYPNDLNEAYQLPSFQTVVNPLFSRRPKQIAGVGSHIGIVISSVIDPNDLAMTFNSDLPLAPGIDLIQAYSTHSNLPVPTVTVRAVDGGSGAFDPNTDAAGEASLDTQMSLGTAPGATETIYNIPDLSDASIADGYAAVDEDNTVDVVSSSFGECELDFTAAYNGGVDFTSILKMFHALFQQGNAEGITFVASSGDSGGVPCLSAAFVNNPTNGTSFVAGVENPASDPNVTGVGGTNLGTTATPTEDDAVYSIENADFDPLLPARFRVGKQIVSVNNNTWGSGGGLSAVFDKPLYQLLVNTSGSRKRAVPDVSLMMGGCPSTQVDTTKEDCSTVLRSSALIWIGGDLFEVIGTSSSSPEFAAVLALAIELNGGRLGNVNPLIYGLSATQTLLGGERAPKLFQYFHRNISGNNNAFTVKPGQAYSEVLGNSTLDVKNFLQLQLAVPAGTPNTLSNP
ncbi:MAG TPA: S53 family serine peptidase [Edaphobacter sp.]|nr:S53 family serine peptidase [Edaphobacter sp.]